MDKAPPPPLPLPSPLSGHMQRVHMLCDLGTLHLGEGCVCVCKMRMDRAHQNALRTHTHMTRCIDRAHRQGEWTGRTKTFRVHPDTTRRMDRAHGPGAWTGRMDPKHGQGAWTRSTDRAHKNPSSAGDPKGRSIHLR